jgi:hypothetical protein
MLFYSFSRPSLGSVFDLSLAELGNRDIQKPLVLSRLRSGLSTHLCGLSLKCQGAFAAER